MKKVKINELTGMALDYAVAKAIGIDVDIGSEFIIDKNRCVYTPSGSWVICGELIDTYWIELSMEVIEGNDRWYASPVHLIGNYADASTPREAICRSVVMIEFDDVVGIPDELLVES